MNMLQWMKVIKNKKMRGIACIAGNLFSITTDGGIDAKWKLQEAYYVAQGCIIIKGEDLRFATKKCECNQCKTLKHEFHDLIEEVREEARNE